MENYIVLNGQKIALTAEQGEEMKKALGVGRVELKTKPESETFKIGKHELIVLEHFGNGTTKVLLKNILCKNQFDAKCNNYASSSVDNICNEFAKEIESIVGNDNVIEHIVDLTADDGLKDYCKIKRKAALLTANDCRRYVYILDKHKLDEYWWTATAYSTAVHNDKVLVKCVSPSGDIDYDYCFNINFGVRPSLILNSNIFVSE